VVRSKVRAAAPAHILDLVAARGGSRERIRDAAGLTERDLADPEHMVDMERVITVTRLAAVELGDDCLGLHMGSRFQLGTFGAMSYAVLNAPTVGGALHNLIRYSRTHIRGPRVGFEIDAQEAILSVVFDGPAELCRQHAEGGAAMFVSLLRRLIGPDWRPRRVLFGHEQPRDISEHERILGPELRFRERLNVGIVLEVEDLGRPVPGADRRLLPIVQRHLDELLASGDRSDALLADVRTAIGESLCDGHLTIQSVARRLRTSVRTLQRRLGESGVVFKTLVDDVRREVALRYVGDGRVELTEVAFLVGYSELSAFGRAFRRWTGSTPQATRRSFRGTPAVPPGARC